MKLKVEIDINEILSDFFEDFDPEYSSAEIDLKSSVKYEIQRKVEYEVLNKYSDNLNTQMSNEVKKLIDKSFKELVESKCSEFVQNGKLKGRYSSSEEVTVEEWIKERFEDSTNHSTLRNIVDNNAKILSKEIRDRYDLLFATQIVTKMNEQGLLKEGVFQSLVENKKK